jgi:hypothetical protein
MFRGRSGNFVWGLVVTVATAPLVAQAIAATPCATCTRDVALSRNEIQCVIERLNKQLSTAVDPVVVATAGCGKKIADGTRLESVRQARKSASKGANGAGGPYLITKSDAQCLLRKLRQIDPKAREVKVDLRQCG